MSGNVDTFLKILDKEKDEELISKWVAFVLHPHNTTPKILEKILEITSADDEVDFVQLYHSSECELRYIQTEARITENSIIDILLLFTNFGIIIENKVNASETSDQSIRYEEYGKSLGKPVKYILLKPDYNPHTLQNESFVSLQYSQLSEILKGITSSELVHEENYIYVEELIRHIDLYLTKVETTAEDIRKSDEVVNELVDRIKQTLDMTIYGTRDKVKYNCIQIWKKGWNTGEEYTNYKGLHYEILFLKEEFSNLCRESGVRIYFDIHNETARRN